MIYSPHVITCERCREDFDERLAQKIKHEDDCDEVVCPDCWDDFVKSSNGYLDEDG